MGKFTVIPQDTFEGLQLDAGVLLKTFDPGNVAAPKDTDIICATTGGINVSCVPTYSDLGEDVDNCPVSIQYILGDAGIFQKVLVDNGYSAIAFQKVSPCFKPYREIVRQMCAKKRSGGRWQVSGRLRGRTAQRIRSPCQWAGMPRTSRSGILRPGNPTGP